MSQVVKPRDVEFSKEIFDTLVASDLNSLLGGPPSQATLAYRNRQLEALHEKFVGPATASASERFSKGLEKFLACEKVMEQTNSRIAQGKLSKQTKRILSAAQHYLFKWLPPVDDNLLNRMCELATPGPGSSVLCKGEQNNLGRKLTRFASTTKDASKFLTRFYSVNTAMALRAKRRYPSRVPGDVLFGVEKDAETMRICGKQPDFNIWLQLGLWHAIEGCLEHRAGLFLRDQSRGWSLAREGSVSQRYATVDLSSASDLISYELIRLLLPSDWFVLLDSLRSPFYSYEDQEGKLVTAPYAKFSAMGNGFTFPLESLVFKAIAHGVLDDLNHSDRVVVYGDDIIVPTIGYQQLVDVLSDLGMKPNLKKSFAAGPFRETCGKEYYCGSEIRPWFIDAPPKNEVDVYTLHNCILTHRWGDSFPLTLRYLRSLVPSGFTQPLYYGAGENWEDWAAWKSTVCAAAFMVAEPPCPPKRHPNFQRPSWKLRRWVFQAFRCSEPEEEFFLPLSLYTGDSTQYMFRRGAWKNRSFEVGYWPSS